MAFASKTLGKRIGEYRHKRTRLKAIVAPKAIRTVAFPIIFVASRVLSTRMRRQEAVKTEAIFTLEAATITSL